MQIRNIWVYTNAPRRGLKIRTTYPRATIAPLCTKDRTAVYELAYVVMGTCRGLDPYIVVKRRCSGCGVLARRDTLYVANS